MSSSSRVMDGQRKIRNFDNEHRAFVAYMRRAIICGELFSYTCVGLQSSDDDSCFEYDREQRLLHRTHPYYFEYNNSSVSATDVSLVTQLSADRLQLLDQLCDYWPGPISLALYMTDEELYEFLLYTMQTPVLASRRNIAYHIVYKEGVSLSCFEIRWF